MFADKKRERTDILIKRHCALCFSKAGGESNYIQINFSSAAWEVITIAYSCFTRLSCCETPPPSLLQGNEDEAPKM